MNATMRWALLFALAAVAVRAPALLHLELNWDEALYWQIAGELAGGQLPYTATWDRKPPGLFALLVPFHVAGGGSVLALRLGTSLLVAATAFALHAIAGRLLPGRPAAGPLAGLAYVLLSIRGVGDGTNAELLIAPLATGAIALALAAAQNRQGRTALLAGVLAGCAILVKQVALAEAAVAGLLLALVPLLRGAALPVPALVRLWAWLAAGGLLPAAVAAGSYTLAGRLGLLLETLGAAGDAGAAPLNIEGLTMGLRLYGGALAAGLLGWAALVLRREAVAAVALGAWLAAVGGMLLLLGRFADHMMIQLLPPAALGIAALAVLAAGVLPRLSPRWAYGAVLLLLLGWSAGGAWRGAAEVAWRRHGEGVPHWGDRTATIAAALRPRMQGGQDLFVVSRMLGLYHATGMRPPTRFPFAMHLWSGYAPVDGMAEMARILAARPGFVVVDDLWMPGGPRQGALHAEIMDQMHAALAQGYVMDGRTGRFMSRGGGFVGGGIGATVFRRADLPARQGDGLVYASSP